MTSIPLLEVTRLTVSYPGNTRRVTAVRGISFALQEGEMFALVGETGCGKSSLGLALLGCLPAQARVDAGEVRLNGKPLPSSDRDPAWRSIRGSQLGLVLQDSRSALNPVLTVGSQLVEAIRAHQKLSRAGAKSKARALLGCLGMQDPQFQMRRYPLELSGGMCQRVALALAICNQPQIVIADEPTSSLDPTLQRQVLDTLKAMNDERRTAILLISHDLSLVAEYADRVAVMYNGSIVEAGMTAQVTGRAYHPYTRGLLAAMPGIDAQRRPLKAIRGSPPARGAEFPGCPFAPRCDTADPRCSLDCPPVHGESGGHWAACFKPEAV